MFALGSKASVAGRGNSNKAFIRTNQTSATVEVRLVNAGEGAYKPEVYGDSIRIARTVTNTSSTYKIMNDNGKPVVERKLGFMPIRNEFSINILNWLHTDLNESFLETTESLNLNVMYEQTPFLHMQ